MNKRAATLAAAVLLLTIIGAVGVWLAGNESQPPGTTADTKQPLFYRHPMTPSITSPVPAKDDMGMDYIAVYAEEAGSMDDALVRISPATVNNLGVRTATVGHGLLTRDIDTVGYVRFDESLLSRVDLRVPGWIEDLQVRTQGERVKAGDLLFRIYSPELETAQREYLQVAGRSAALRTAGAARLRALGLGPAEIARLEKTRQPSPLVPIYARQDGVVAELDVREGMYITPGTTVMTLAGLDRVWVLVDVFEQQADWVAVGQPVEVRLPHRPAAVWQGEIEFIYPQLDPQTRTLRARLTLPNPGEALKPNMYADVTLRSDARHALSVPAEAVIRTGAGARVILARGEGRFDPADVVTGIESGDRIEILEGLAAGDRVVVSAQFLLDSEASLQAGLRRLQTPERPHADAEESSVPDDTPTIEPLVWAEGTVNEIALEDSSLNLTHQPIPDLGWPAMTMDFAVDETVDLTTLEPGQTLRLGLAERDGRQVIAAIEAVAPAASATGSPLIRTAGTLAAIDVAGHSVTLSHEPIPELGWPAMTMKFAVAEAIDLTEFEAGKPVRVGFEQTDGGPVITVLTSME